MIQQRSTYIRRMLNALFNGTWRHDINSLMLSTFRVFFFGIFACSDRAWLYSVQHVCEWPFLTFNMHTVPHFLDNAPPPPSPFPPGVNIRYFWWGVPPGSPNSEPGYFKPKYVIFPRMCFQTWLRSKSCT